MKLAKKVFVLSVVVLSLGSSVAFGCDANKNYSVGSPFDAPKPEIAGASTHGATSGGTQSGGADISQPKSNH